MPPGRPPLISDEVWEQVNLARKWRDDKLSWPRRKVRQTKGKERVKWQALLDERQAQYDAKLEALGFPAGTLFYGQRIVYPCGTAAAAHRHYKNGEKPCRECAEAMRKTKRGYERAAVVLKNKTAEMQALTAQRKAKREHQDKLKARMAFGKEEEWKN